MMFGMISFLMMIVGAALAIGFVARDGGNAEERMGNAIFVMIGVGLAAIGGLGFVISLLIFMFGATPAAAATLGLANDPAAWSWLELFASLFLLGGLLGAFCLIATPRRDKNDDDRMAAGTVMALVVGVILTVLVIIAVYVSVQPAAAHDAPTGWSYPAECCSGIDCREIADTAIDETQAGFVIRASGETIAAADTRIRVSPDGRYHWCAIIGLNEVLTTCLFVPPRSY